MRDQEDDQENDEEGGTEEEIGEGLREASSFFLDKKYGFW